MQDSENKNVTGPTPVQGNNVLVPFGSARLEIAKLAMQSMIRSSILTMPLANGSIIRDLMKPELIAEYCFSVADAMMKEYAKGPTAKDPRF